MDVAELARETAHGDEDPRRDQHLHPRGHERAAREQRVALVDRTRGPARGRAEREHQPAHVDLALERVPADEQRRADEPHREPDDHQARLPVPEDDPVDRGHPQRDRGDRQARHPGGDRAFGPHDATVAAEHHQRRHHGRASPLHGSGPVAAAVAEPERDGQQQAARDQEAEAAAEQRRHRLVHDPDADEGRAPRHVDQAERRPDHRGGTAPSSGRLLDRSGHAVHDTAGPGRRHYRSVVWRLRTRVATALLDPLARPRPAATHGSDRLGTSWRPRTRP